METKAVEVVELAAFEKGGRGNPKVLYSVIGERKETIPETVNIVPRM